MAALSVVLDQVDCIVQYEPGIPGGPCQHTTGARISHTNWLGRGSHLDITVRGHRVASLSPVLNPVGTVIWKLRPGGCRRLIAAYTEFMMRRLCSCRANNREELQLSRQPLTVSDGVPAACGPGPAEQARRVMARSLARPRVASMRSYPGRWRGG